MQEKKQSLVGIKNWQKKSAKIVSSQLDVVRGGGLYCFVCLLFCFLFVYHKPFSDKSPCACSARLTKSGMYVSVCVGV